MENRPMRNCPISTFAYGEIGIWNRIAHCPYVLCVHGA